MKHHVTLMWQHRQPVMEDQSLLPLKSGTGSDGGKGCDGGIGGIGIGKGCDSGILCKSWECRVCFECGVPCDVPMWPAW